MSAREQFRAAFAGYRILHSENYGLGPNTRRAERALVTISATPSTARYAAAYAYTSASDPLVYHVRTRQLFRRSGIAVRL